MNNKLLMAAERELSHVGVEIANSFEAVFSKSYHVREVMLIVLFHDLVLVKVFLLNNLGLEDLLLEIVLKFRLASSLFLVLGFWPRWNW